MKKFLRKLFHGSPKREPLNPEKTLKLLCEARDIFVSLGKKMWITDGTLLGFHREGRFLSHDLDMDIACMIDEFDETIADTFVQRGWKLKRTLGEVDCGLEQTWVKNDTYLDIFYFYRDGDVLWHGAWRRDKQKGKRNLIRYEYRPFELAQAEYMGASFPVPQDIEGYVTQKYGKDWRTPRKQWDWALDPENARETDIWR